MDGLIVANGMLTADEWWGGTAVAKAIWLACLDDRQVRAQASVIAVARCISVSLVLLIWMSIGLLPSERMVAA